MTSWKIITGSATAIMGVVIVVAASMAEIHGNWRLSNRSGTTVLADQGTPISVVAYAGPGPATVVAAGEIDVDGGTVPLAPSAEGMVVEIPVQEGAEIKAGQPILRLDSRLAELQVDQATAALAEASVQLEQAKQKAQTHKHKLEQLRQSIVAAAARLQAAERQANKLEALRPKETVAEETYLTAKDQLIELQAMLKVTKEQLAEAELIDPNLMVRQAEVAENAARAKLAAAREHLSKHTLTAPCDGQVLRLQVGVGQILSSKDPRPLIWFCPNKPLVVRCEVEQEFADRIEPGMKVMVSNETFDGRKWLGKIRRCAPWVAPRRTVWNKVFEVSDVPTVECLVDLEPGQKPLRIGQRVRVTVEPAPVADESRSESTANDPS